MEVKFAKYLFVVLIALLGALTFVTGLSLVLIDVYVQPIPEAERFVVFDRPAAAVVDEPTELSALAMMAVEPPAASDTMVPLSTAKLGLLGGEYLNTRIQKPTLLAGRVILGGELVEPLRSYAEPTPAEVVMALPVGEIFDSVSIVTEPTQTAVPTQPPLPEPLLPTVTPTALVEPTAAATESPTLPTATPTETILAPTAEPPESTASPTPIPISDDIYVVRYGDSLLSIATKLGVTKAILIEVNGLTDQSIIHPGDQLKVPDITHIGVPHIGQIVWPVEARYIIKRYRYGHRAIDIVLPSGSPVVAVAAGTVEYAGWHQYGYGYMVLIDHGNGVTSLYAHNSAFHIKAGDVVEQGQLIADSGNTGNSTMPHLHLELQANGQMLNPCLYLPDGC